MSNSFISNKVTDYVSDGFQRICDVYNEYADDRFTWQLWNINEDLLWNDHNSWVYFIVSGDVIMKVGETSQPLGIKSTICLTLGAPSLDTDYEYKSVHWYQPVAKSTNRFGRLCNFYEPTDTDWYIRNNLHNDVINGQVSLWARKCEKVEHTYQIAGKSVTVYGTVHKDLEVLYIDAIAPELNKGRK